MTSGSFLGSIKFSFFLLSSWECVPVSHSFGGQGVEIVFYCSTTGLEQEQGYFIWEQGIEEEKIISFNKTFGRKKLQEM